METITKCIYRVIETKLLQLGGKEKSRDHACQAFRSNEVNILKSLEMPRRLLIYIFNLY